MSPRPFQARRFPLHHWLWFFCLTAGHSVFALDAKRAITQYARRSWGMENGLPNRVVTSVLQTKDGYLWAGTEGGLARFDGERFTLFTTANTQGLPGSLVIGLYEDQQNNLWVATSRGIARYAQGKFQSFSTANGMSHDTVLSFLDLGAEGLVFGTLKGLCRFRAGRMEIDPRDQALAGKPIFAVARDAQQNLWAAVYGQGLHKLNALGQEIIYTTKQGLPSEAVSALLFDSQQRLWVGTGAGFTIIKGGQVQRLQTVPAPPPVSGFLEDRDHNIWLHGQQGLWRFTAGDPAHFASYLGVNDNRHEEFYQLSEDREGNLWAASSSGLTRFSDGNVYCWSAEEGLRGRRVSALVFGQPTGLLIGTEQGVNVLENGQVRPFAPQQSFFRRAIELLYTDREGVLWVNTAEGLASWQGGRLQRWGAAQGLTGNGVRNIGTGPAGEMLLAVNSRGLMVRTGNRVVPHPLQQEISEKLQATYLIHTARDGTLWLGSATGLAAIRDGRANYFLTAQFPALRDLLSVTEDETGTLWIGSYDGLIRFRNGQAALLTTRHGLPENKVTFLTPDGQGKLWIGCNQGIYAVSLAELNQCADGQTGRANARHYGLADGLKTIEAPNIFAGAQRAADGKLYFATLDGVAMIDANAPPRPNSAPPVFIERVRADERELSLEAPLTVPAEAQRLYFDYTALSFRDPAAVRFRYRLEGFDRQWMEVGNQRENYYMALPPGTYTFRVQAAVGDSNWSASSAQLQLTVLPRFYRTWWFIALCVAAICLLAWAAYRLRMKQLQAQYGAVLSERTRMAQELHDTLSHTFTGVIVQLEAANSLLAKQKGDPASHLARAMRMAREGLTEARRAVYALRPEALEARPLPEALTELVADTKAKSGLPVELCISGATIPIPQNVALHTFRIVQEAISNARQHAAAQRIAVELQVQPQHLMVRVTDDGRGFAAAAATSGYGLIGMHERAQRIGGHLTIASPLGQGTTVTLEVAFRKAS